MHTARATVFAPSLVVLVVAVTCLLHGPCKSRDETKGTKKQRGKRKKGKIRKRGARKSRDVRTRSLTGLLFSSPFLLPLILFSFLFEERHPVASLRCTMIYKRKIHLRKLWPTLVAIAQHPDPIVNLTTTVLSKCVCSDGRTALLLF